MGLGLWTTWSQPNLWRKRAGDWVPYMANDWINHTCIMKPQYKLWSPRSGELPDWWYASMCQEGDASWGYWSLVFGTVPVFSGATISQDGFLQYSGFMSLALSSPCLSYWTALAPPLLLCFSESSPKSSFLFSCSYFIIHCRFSFYHRKLELEIVKRTPTIIGIGNTMCAPLHLWVCLPRTIAWNASPCLHCEFQIII